MKRLVIVVLAAIGAGSAMSQGLSDTTLIGLRHSEAASASTDYWTATTTTSAPSGRGDFTAVWTGSKMIVWGGDNQSALFNDGGQYDPVGNAWTSTTTAGAPSPRSNHTAVWTGSKMIVWGGSYWSTNFVLLFLGDGGQYDPVADSWIATTTAGAPRARGWHTAIWTGSKMIVWGGSGGNSHLNDGGQYDPFTNTWTATTTAGAPQARGWHSAVWTGSKMIVWGGNTLYTEMPVLNDGGQYDPVADSWIATTTAGAPRARGWHTAIWTGSKMIVWGGRISGQSPLPDVSLNDGGRYDPVGNVWSATNLVGAPPARVSHSAVWTGSRMVVWGGYNLPTGLLGDGSQYDPASNAWAAMTTSAAPSPREVHSAIWTGARMIVWGGLSSGGFISDGAQWVPSVIPSCTEDSLTLCLIGGRYKITSFWRNQYAGGAMSNLYKAHLTDATGAFWLSDANTYEYLIRINTATNNGRAWIAIPTFTDVEFWVMVQDTVNGQAQTYHSIPGNRTLLYDPTFFVYP